MGYFSRRQMLAGSALAFLGACGGGGSSPTPSPTPTPTPAPAPTPTSLRLSTTGSNRATGYYVSNKVIELPDRFIATWLESDGSNVGVMLGVFRYDMTEISRLVLAGAENNHGGADITLDGAGYLHVLYGPHGNPMRYRRSVNPNDFTSFTAETTIGQYLTYPASHYGPDHLTHYLIAREGTGDTGLQGTLQLYERKPGAAYELIATPLKNRTLGYAAFNPTIAIDAAGRMHVSILFHEGTVDAGYGLSQCVGYMFSDDMGRTWQSSRGPFAMPGTLEDTDVLFRGGIAQGTVGGNGNIVVGPDGIPRMLILVENAVSYQTNLYLASKLSQGWRLRDLGPSMQGLPAGASFCDVGVLSPVGSLFRMVFGVQRIQAGERDSFSGVAWGHPTNTIYTALFGTDDSTINVSPVAQQPDGLARWLVNIERPVRVGQQVSPRLAVYTRGSPDGGYLGGGAEVWAAKL